MIIDTSGLSLVGRESELAVITDFLVRAARGGGVLRLHGEPGIGKTALLDAAVSTTSAASTRVVRAEGVEHASSTISSGLNQVLLPLSGGRSSPTRSPARSGAGAATMPRPCWPWTTEFSAPTTAGERHSGTLQQVADLLGGPRSGWNQHPAPRMPRPRLRWGGR
jgi:hypothetical protein